MTYKIQISPTFFQEIKESLSFLANVSKKAANELYDEIYKSISELKEFPYRCPLVRELSFLKIEARKLIIHNGEYTIIYTISNNIVFINSFVDNRKKPNIFNYFIN